MYTLHTSIVDVKLCSQCFLGDEAKGERTPGTGWLEIKNCPPLSYIYFRGVAPILALVFAVYAKKWRIFTFTEHNWYHHHGNWYQRLMIVTTDKTRF